MKEEEQNIKIRLKMALPSFASGRLKTFLAAVLCLLLSISFSEAVLFNARRQPSSSMVFYSGDDDLGESHARVRRAAHGVRKPDNVSEMATAVHLNNSHLHLMVHWAGQDSPVVLCLGRDQV